MYLFIMCVFSVFNVFERRRPSALPFSEGWVGPVGCVCVCLWVGGGKHVSLRQVELSIELGHGSSFN